MVEVHGLYRRIQPRSIGYLEVPFVRAPPANTNWSKNKCAVIRRHMRSVAQRAWHWQAEGVALQIKMTRLVEAPPRAEVLILGFCFERIRRGCILDLS